MTWYVDFNALVPARRLLAFIDANHFVSALTLIVIAFWAARKYLPSSSPLRPHLLLVGWIATPAIIGLICFHVSYYAGLSNSFFTSLLLLACGLFLYSNYIVALSIGNWTRRAPLDALDFPVIALLLTILSIPVVYFYTEISYRSFYLLHPYVILAALLFVSFLIGKYLPDNCAVIRAVQHVRQQAATISIPVLSFLQIQKFPAMQTASPGNTQPAPQPEPGQSLSDALRDFAKLEELTAAPTPAKPVKQPEFNPSLPDLPALSHMKTANSYIENVQEEAARKKGLSHDEAFDFLFTIDTAAQHIARARNKDPEITLTLTNDNGESVPITLDDLSAKVLELEGELSRICAELWEGPQQDGYEYLERSRGAWENAIKYKPHRAESHYQLAETHKLLGNKDASISCARKALQYDPHHFKAIKFLDHSGGEFEPKWRNVPYKEPFRLPFRLYWLPIGWGVFIFFIAPYLFKPDQWGDMWFFRILVGAIPFCFGLRSAWKHAMFELEFAHQQRVKYDGYVHAQHEAKMKRYEQQNFARRYDEEKKERRRQE